MDPPTVTPTTAAATASAAAAAASVQHVNKKSSDELLRKFADSGDEAPAKKQVLRVSKRRKRSQKNGEGDQCESPLHGSSLVERRSLLPAGTKSKALLRQLGIHGRASHLRARDIRNKSLFCTIHKTWRRTIEGASKVFMEKHYNRHRRLINDIV